MKKAYLILAHNNEKHLNRLVKSLDDGNSKFFIHVDRKSKIKFKLLQNNSNVIFLKNRNKVYWGGYSIVNATNKLIKEAFEYKEKNYFDYYCLLSGADYPIKNNKYIDSFLRENRNKNFINVVEMPHMTKSIDRVSNVHFEGIYRSNFIRMVISRLLNRVCQIIGIKNKIPKEYKSYKFYAGSQWWIFNKFFIEYLYKFINREKGFVKFYKRCYIPDESFYQTIIMNSKYKNSVLPSCTYTDWQIGKPPYPSVIEKEHIEIIEKNTYANEIYGNQNIIFARKFTDDSDEIINFIEEKIRNK